MITDIKMPNMDGIGLLKRARRYHPDLPVLFITGVASEDIIGEASPDGFLAKPFRISRLEELIENALVARRTGRITHPQQPRRVLVNVTEDGFRQMLSEALTFGKFLPFAVNGDEEAFEELERGDFDAMITGIEKDLAGSQSTVNRVREQYPSLPMLAVSSSYTSEEVDKLECQSKLDGFVQKPFSVGRLFEMLDRAIAGHPAGSN
jgi:DNA-binding NtrC family response regulator